MTNAAVETTAGSVDGQVLTVKYKSADKTEEKKVIVPPDAAIVTYAPADKSELKPGAQIIIFGAQKQPDGTLQAQAVNVGGASRRRCDAHCHPGVAREGRARDDERVGTTAQFCGSDSTASTSAPVARRNNPIYPIDLASFSSCRRTSRGWHIHCKPLRRRCIRPAGERR